MSAEPLANVRGKGDMLDPMKTALSLFSPQFFGAYECVNDCCLDLAIEAFSGAEHEITALVSSAEADKRKYLAQTVLAVLVQSGLMIRRESSGVWERVETSRWKEAHCLERCARSAALFPECRAMFDLVALARTGILEFLAGAASGQDILFPKGDGDVWHRYNNENLITAVYPRLTAAVAAACVRQDRPVRILELGAGTGSGTTELLKTIGPVAQYIYSDLGPSFVRQGRKRFGDLPFMQFMRLSIDEPLTGQGIDVGSFDLIVGVNVLHAARRLEQTLECLLQGLRPGGYLVLGEGSPPALERRWMPDLVFALLEGWWNGELTRTRSRPGFLMPHEWRVLLSNAGFADIRTIPGEAFFSSGDCYGGAVAGRRER